MLACQCISVKGEQWIEQWVVDLSNSKYEVMSNPFGKKAKCGGFAVLKRTQHSVQHFCFRQDKTRFQGILCVTFTG